MTITKFIKYKNFVQSFFNMLYSLNHDQNEPITFYQKYYDSRIGFKTSYSIAKLIWLD